MMRTAGVGPEAAAGLDRGPGDTSSRHGSSGAQVLPGGDLIQSSRRGTRGNTLNRALIQSQGKLIQSDQVLVQSEGLLARGAAGLQVRVAVIKRTRLDPLPCAGPLTAPTINSREDGVTSSQGGNPQTRPSQRRPSLARAAARGRPGSVGVSQGPVNEEHCPGVMRHGLEIRAGVGSAAELTPRKTRRKIRLSGVRGRGQLQLSITSDGNELDIHIHQAWGLLGRYCGTVSCDTYVKPITGWYYMLGAELGRTKHLKVASQENRAITPAKRAKGGKEFQVVGVRGQHGEKTPDATLDKPPPPGLSSRARTDMNKPQLGPLPGPNLPTLGPVPGTNRPPLGPLPGPNLPTMGPVPGPSRPNLGSGSDVNQLLLGAASSGRNKMSKPDSDPIHLPLDSGSNKLSLILGSGSNQPNLAAGSSEPSKASLGWASGSSEQGPKERLRSMFTLESKTSACRSGVSVQNSKATLMVSIMRGNDGFGFTICSDCPVRVQSVEPGGPAHQAGLQQGDCVLQMNGVPVESWQCVDLAHAIRSSTQIVLVVWRSQPDLKPSCTVSPTSTTVKKLLPHPPNSKHGRRKGQSSGVRSRLGSLWREEESNYPTTTTTTTLKGTRVTSSNGDNYIILSPVEPGSQMLQTVYQDGNGTIGRLYQTHPSRGLHQQEPHFHQQPPMEWTGGGRSFKTATLPPPSSSTSLVLSPAPVLPGCYSNYQNCTMVQSHLPCSSYGNYGTLAPKTLIFPVFVQPLDLCSADRTLLMAEEMLLHQGSLQPTKVTLLIYTDLLLLTREDEAGRCNVLQSPLYLHNIRLHYVSSEPLRLYLAQCVGEHWECDLSLEAFSLDQKTRVSLCLHDNITQQLAVPVETPHSNQLDLSSRPSSPYATFSELPLRSSSPPPPPPPPSTHFLPFSPERCAVSPSPWILAPPLEPPSKRCSYPPVWKGRGGGGGELESDKGTERVCGRTWKGRETRREGENEREERQAGEGQSVSEASESIWGGDSAPLSCCSSPLPPISPPPPYNMIPTSTRKTQHGVASTEDEEEEEEEEEGEEEEDVLEESSNTIHKLTRPLTSEPDHGHCSPSPHTLRRELTREGGSLQQMFQFLNGIKDRECKYGPQKRKKSLAEDIRNRLSFLRRQNNFNANSLERAFRNTRPPLEEVWRWADSFEALLSNKYGMAVFRHFLRSEFSEENLDFWLAVEKYKRTRTLTKMATKAHSIFNEFISTSASRQVNVDSSVREMTNQSLLQAPGPASFKSAQDQIYSLMESDSYPRFLKSLLYSQLANQKPAHAHMDSQRGDEGGSTKSCNGIGPMSLSSQSEQKTLI
ncbi:unnamed protein product [Merluccius merluccius]